MGRNRLWAIVLLAACLSAGMPGLTTGQQLTYRGFAEAGVRLYPLDAPNDPTNVVADGAARFEPSLRVRRGLSLAGSVEARVDSHEQTGSGGVYWDRSRLRPVFAVRSLSASFVRGRVGLEVGKQFVRWGQSDIISPTDHFTARDYLIPVESEVLAVTAARLTLTAANDAFEVVYAPRLTPSRIPLLDQRWVGLQAATTGRTLRDGPVRYPGGGLYGARWHHGGRLEYSATFFQGFHNLPVLDVALAADASVVVGKHYPALRAWGADAATTVPGLTVKAETAWFQARQNDADDYGLWVVQGERQQGEWLLIGGYVGEWVSQDRPVLRFEPDRGLARSLIGRASRDLAGGGSLLVEAVVRQDADGVYVRGEYSRAFRAHWRVTLQLLVLGGDDMDFLGQYRRNSLTGARGRYSF